MIAAVVIALLFALILINVPIGVAICAAALVGMVWQNGVFGLYNAALALFDGATSFPLIAIPLFILAGALMNTGGISRRLIDFTSALIGFIRGGLAMVNVAVSMFFAEISGSAVADVAAIGSVLIPAMKRKRYRATLRGGGHLLVGIARHHHPAVDPDDPLRRAGRHLHRAALRRRRRSRDCSAASPCSACAGGSR